MSRRRAYSDTTLLIMQRFFDAFDALRAMKQIKNVSSFCLDNSIDKRHLYAQRQDLGKGYFEVSWLVPLIEKHGVSSYWLMTGKGTMFNG